MTVNAAGSRSTGSNTSVRIQRSVGSPYVDRMRSSATGRASILRAAAFQRRSPAR